MSIGKNLRAILQEKNLKLTDIENISKVSYADIRNILHDRSHNIEKIKKIVEALNVPIESVITPTLDNLDIDIELFFRSIQCLHKALIIHKKTLKKKILDELITSIYTYINKNPDEIDEKIIGFAEGIIHSKLSIRA